MVFKFNLKTSCGSCGMKWRLVHRDLHLNYFYSLLLYMGDLKILLN